ncbi:MAG TPA: hypothetical protein VIY47_01835 [Ignavibacteriaceae bacterium]
MNSILDEKLIPTLKKYINIGNWYKMPMRAEDYKIVQQAEIICNYKLTRMFNEHSPNMTVCPHCHVDDFTHMEGCDLIDTEI